VTEVCWSVPTDDLCRHLQACETVALDRVDVEGRGIDIGHHVRIEIDKSTREEFDRRESLVEIPRCHQAIEQRLRDRLARLVVHREALQHGGFAEPVFIDLRGQLDKIGRHGSPCGPDFPALR